MEMRDVAYGNESEQDRWAYSTDVTYGVEW